MALTKMITKIAATESYRTYWAESIAKWITPMILVGLAERTMWVIGNNKTKTKAE